MSGTLAVSDVHKATFGTRSERGSAGVVVHMRGNADIDAQEQLKLFLDALHDEARRLGLGAIVFDLDELYFMNSSCLSLLLRFVNAAMPSPNSQGIRLTFRSNPHLRWQRRSLQALRSYAPDIVSIE
jgi:anti-anti-sigma factor